VGHPSVWLSDSMHLFNTLVPQASKISTCWMGRFLNLGSAAAIAPKLLCILPSETTSCPQAVHYRNRRQHGEIGKNASYHLRHTKENIVHLPFGEQLDTEEEL
jgi:hypothetical protein